jgi:hypothetical protein
LALYAWTPRIRAIWPTPRAQHVNCFRQARAALCRTPSNLPGTRWRGDYHLRGI